MPTPPFQPQYADRDRIGEFLDHPASLRTDARHRDFGFASADDYASWAPRLCGIACLKMVLGAHGLANDATMASLTDGAVAAGAYAFADPARGLAARGWIYAPLLDYARTLGLDGTVCAPYPLEQLIDDLRLGRHPIVSVHPGVMREDADAVPVGEGGGHLVLALDAAPSDGTTIREVVLHNPNARTRRTQDAYRAPLPRFTTAFAGRGLVLWPAAPTYTGACDDT